MRKTKVLKDIQPDEKLAEEIQSNLDDQLKEKQLEESEELKTILHGVTGKEMRWAIYSAISKQKEKQRCQEQKISSLQIAVILQGIAVIILDIGGIILKNIYHDRGCCNNQRKNRNSFREF